MAEKLKAMLGSVRFWYAVILSVAVLLETLEIVPEAYTKTLEVFSLLGIGVRTVDRFK